MAADTDLDIGHTAMDLIIAVPFSDCRVSDDCWGVWTVDIVGGGEPPHTLFTSGTAVHGGEHEN